MATTYKVLGTSNPSATTATTLYTVPAATSAIVSTINICNQGSLVSSFRVAIRPAGATLAANHYIAFDTAIPAYDSIAMTIGITLAATDVITVYASSATMSFLAFGTEIT
jgi:glucose-6-phosphate dehydrogenase assembly protein OpcA